jgi:GntR family transcriptional regulator
VRIIISNSSAEAIYEQIARQIKAEIIAGTLEEGAPLPSIRALAHDLQVSVITTKRAYDELEREGFLDSVGGKGTFVAAQNPAFLREKRMKVVEEKLATAVDEARVLGIGLDEISDMLRLLYEEER